MLRNKDIKNLSELKKTFVDRQKKSDFFIKYVEILQLSKLHSIFSKVKTKGISVKLLIGILITMPFIEERTINSFVQSWWNGVLNLGKDVFYRLKNNPALNWRNFLYGVVKMALANIDKRTEESGLSQAIKAFVFDDTSILKRGITIEGVSRIWDHVIQKSILGYHLLVMEYYNGTHSLPVDFSFHRSKGKNKQKPYNLSKKEYRKQFRKKRAKTTPGRKRVKELDMTKIQSSINMLKRAVERGIIADYVLTDSWFTCYEFVKETLSLGLHYIGMFSKVKTLFKYNNTYLTYKNIRQLNRKNIKRSRKHNLYYIRVVAEWKGIPVVLYFTRQGKHGNWKTLISTDLSSTFNETVSVYQIRWTIEVFFKECKQLLGLGKSQSNDFDAQIADTTITMIQYIFLNLQNSVENYESIGGVFKNTKQDIQQVRLHERIWLILLKIIDIVLEVFEQSDMYSIIRRIINDEKVFIKILAFIEADDKCSYSNAA